VPGRSAAVQTESTGCSCGRDHSAMVSTHHVYASVVLQRDLFQNTKKRTSCLDMSGVVNGTRACQGGDPERS
jgi:hypothetical protein